MGSSPRSCGSCHEKGPLGGGPFSRRGGGTSAARP
jgi:hypothetical protein